MEAAQVVAELLAQPAFSNLVARNDQLIAPALGSYLTNCAPEGIKQTAKAVKDAVWGMIDLRGQEIIILDSPILQRLHHVRQLGVTYLTYPTAGYSRYEHTLGAMHQAERMLHAIAARSRAKVEILED